MALTWTKKLQNIPLLKPLFGYGQQKPPVVVGLPEEGDPGGPSTAWDFYQARMKLAADRLATYHEFEVMDEDDVIVAALDLYAEEATQPDMIKGRVVWAESDNEDLQEILNNLLESLDMDMEAFAICREMCLYGDSFSAILQTVRDDKAPGPIVGLKALDPKDIHRHEDKLGRLQGFSRGHTPDPEKISKPWDYIHFRLLGKSRISRYGTGVLFPARKVYRMLRLMEDSMAIYRLKRVPGRLAFGLTGLQGLPFERRFSVINRVRREMSKRMFIDPTQSKVAQEVNPLCFTGDTIIPLLDGRKLSMEQIASEFGIREKSFWVYSYDKDTGRVVPGKAVCLGITGKNAKLVEIELDSGEKLRCTPEHKWMLRNGEYCEAKDLAAGDSLMPLQRIYTPNRKKTSLYEKVRHPGSMQYEFTHRAMIIEGSPNKGKCVHHRNFDKADNRPENLEPMGWGKHSLLHSELGHKNGSLWGFNNARKTVPDFQERQVEGWRKRVATDSDLRRRLKENGSKQLTKYNKSEAHRKRTAELNTILKKGKPKNMSPEASQKMSAMCSAYWADALFKDKMSALHKKEMTRKWQDPETRAKLTRSRCEGYASRFLATGAELTKESYEQWRKTQCQNVWSWKTIEKYAPDILQANHKVVAVRFVDEREDVYDICVEKHHNFALEAGVFVSNSVDENVYYDSSSVNITNLPGVAGNDRPYDIEYMKKRLFMCLRIPPDYLGQAEARGGLLAQSPLAHQEVQFARQCKRIQGAFVAGIVRLCQIHMAWCGIDPLEEKNEFKIGVQPISYLEEMERSNLTRIRAETIILLEQIGQALDLDKTAWLDYVFKLSGFPEDIIESSKPEGSVEAPVQGDVALSKEEQRVHDVVKNNKLVESILGRLIPEAVPGGQSSKASRINRSELPNKKDV